MEPKLGTGKNIFTGKKVTAEDQENALAIGRKAILYKIFKEISTDKGKAFDFTEGFISFLIAEGELLYRHPDLYRNHEGDGTVVDDFIAMQIIVSRYLATQRILKQKTAGLPEWERRSTSQEIDQNEIGYEGSKLWVEDETFDEISEITRLVYGVIRYQKGTDRIIPMLREMGRDFAEGVQ